MNNPYKYIDPTGKKVKSYKEETVYNYKWEKSGNTVVRIQVPFGKRITYETEKGSNSVLLTNRAYETISQTAQRQSQTTLSAFSFGRNMQQEYTVSAIEKAQGRNYEPRGSVQQFLQNKGVQIGSSSVASVFLTPYAGGAVSGEFARLDLEEKRAAGNEIGIGDLGWAYLDVIVGSAGGNVMKNININAAEIAGINIGEHVFIDIASNIESSIAYDIYKSAVEDANNKAEGTGND